MCYYSTNHTYSRLLVKKYLVGASPIIFCLKCVSFDHLCRISSDHQYLFHHTLLIHPTDLGWFSINVLLPHGPQKMIFFQICQLSIIHFTNVYLNKYISNSIPLCVSICVSMYTLHRSCNVGEGCRLCRRCLLHSDSESFLLGLS